MKLVARFSAIIPPVQACFHSEISICKYIRPCFLRTSKPRLLPIGLNLSFVRNAKRFDWFLKFEHE